MVVVAVRVWETALAMFKKKEKKHTDGLRGAMPPSPSLSPSSLLLLLLPPPPVLLLYGRATAARDE